MFSFISFVCIVMWCFGLDWPLFPPSTVDSEFSSSQRCICCNLSCYERSFNLSTTVKEMMAQAGDAYPDSAGEVCDFKVGSPAICSSHSSSG
ncbi:hypothetical protein HOY80DRAFT_978460 [Tuber brumale]|nr:hypothetical protein HOY80DRAFT_978460 [Tuber brumale]